MLFPPCARFYKMLFEHVPVPSVLGAAIVVGDAVIFRTLVLFARSKQLFVVLDEIPIAGQYFSLFKFIAHPLPPFRIPIF